MTATEKAKRSDALYYETYSVNRRVLCDMIANREADIEDLRGPCATRWHACVSRAEGSRRTRRRTATFVAGPRSWGWTSEQGTCLRL